MNGIKLEGACDFHTHLRGGAGEPESIFQMALADTMRNFRRFLPMPNTDPQPIETAEHVVAYREKIMQSAPEAEPVMTIYLTVRTTPEIIVEAAKAGAKAAKYYPKGGTTNSKHGLTPAELLTKRDLFAAMAEVGMVLCLHAEDPAHEDHTIRERMFLPVFAEIARDFPRLRIVFEHVSSEMGFQWALRHPNVAVTVAVPHLFLTTANVVGNHGCLCMPVAKSADDRRALRGLVGMGNPRVFAGTDSAPHAQFKKDKEKGAFGIYSARYAPALYASIFAQCHTLARLSDFLCKFGNEWYQLEPSRGEIEIVREPLRIPDVTEEPGFDPAQSVKHFMAGQELDFNVRYR
jgi:dihydroorotase